MAKGDIGAILKRARMAKGFSQADVADRLRLGSPQSISDWERNYGSGIPVPALKKLIKLYGLSEEAVFEALLEFQYRRLEASLRKEFSGKNRS